MAIQLPGSEMRIDFVTLPSQYDKRFENVTENLPNCTKFLKFVTWNLI